VSVAFPILHVDEVTDNHIEALARALEILVDVLVVDLHARVVVDAGAPLRDQLAAKVDELAVDIHHDHLLDTVVAQRLARRRALSAAHDQYLARARMDEQRGVRQRLVVDGLVGGARLYIAVQRHAHPVNRRPEEKVLLIACAPVREHLLHVAANTIGSVGGLAVLQHASPPAGHRSHRTRGPISAIWRRTRGSSSATR